MNCSNQTGFGMRMPAPQQVMGQEPVAAMPGCSMEALRDRFPVGMGYVPMQQWEMPYPMERALMRGTIFSALDYPFVMGRCR